MRYILTISPCRTVLVSTAPPIQGRRNDFDIGEACLTSAEGASVMEESTREGAPSRWGEGGSPRNF